MIFFVELQMQGEKHVEVNSGLLNVLKICFPKENINVFCDNIHQKNIRTHVNSNKIIYSIFEYTGNAELKKSKLINKTFREVKLALKIFIKAKRKKCERIFFASASPFTAPLLNLFTILFRQNIIICLHGDLGVLRINRRKLTTNIYKSVIKFFFKTRSNRTGLIFYGKIIKENLFTYFPKWKRKNIICINHPYNYDYKDDRALYRENKKITIACIGTGLISKNSHFLYKIAELQKMNIEDGQIEFIQIGNVSNEVLSYVNEYVTIVNNNQFIPSNVFYNNISKADYFIYFFTDNSYYDLCPSGTFFDAIKYCKPILSLHNSFFDYYFNKLGNIGYLFNSMEEMNKAISEILKGGLHTEEYNNQVKTLKNSQTRLSIQNIAKSFIEQYKDLN